MVAMKNFTAERIERGFLIGQFLHSAGETLAVLWFFDGECDLLTSNFLIALVAIVQYYMLGRQV